MVRSGYQPVDDVEMGTTSTAYAPGTAANPVVATPLQRQNSRDGLPKGGPFGTTSHWYVSDEDKFQGSVDAYVRLGFIRKVYSLLTCQMFLTVVVCSACMYNADLRFWCVNQSTAALYIGMIPTFITLFALMFMKGVLTSEPLPTTRLMNCNKYQTTPHPPLSPDGCVPPTITPPLAIPTKQRQVPGEFVVADGLHIF